MVVMTAQALAALLPPANPPAEPRSGRPAILAAGVPRLA